MIESLVVIVVIAIQSLAQKEEVQVGTCVICLEEEQQGTEEAMEVEACGDRFHMACLKQHAVSEVGTGRGSVRSSSPQ